jgi:ABC-type multidrug transport system fused ATPase/permease subunit
MLLIFTLHVVARGQPLTAEIAFTSITLIQIIQGNIARATYMSKNVTGAWVSIQRINRFFSTVTPLQHHPIGPLQIQDGSFRLHERATFFLKDISINFVEGGLNVISGPSGSGKSTMLMAILGETLVEKGSITCPQDIAFASQSAWLQNETIRDNITFNSPFEETRYERIIEACGLLVDLNEFTERDGTEVGENGSSLSGGQRSRVALARALYSKAPVLLLDDIFSALDAKTAASVWEECFCSDILKNRTIVLVTQLAWIREQADMAVSLENGTIKDTQQNIGVVRTSISLATEMLDDSNVDTTLEVTANPTATKGSVTPQTVIKTAEQKRSDEVTQEALKTGPTARLQCE